MATGEGLPPEVAMLDTMAGAPTDAPPDQEVQIEGGTVRPGVLPSRGYLYGDGDSGGNFLMRMMTTEDEELFGSQKGDRTTIIDELIRRTWIQPFVAYEEVLAQDKYYMLFFLRSISIGTDYRFDIKCEECGLKFRHQIELPEGLERRELEEEDNEPFYADLPVVGKRIGIRHLRVKHEDRIRKQAERAYSQSTKPGSPEYSLRLAHHLVSIDGEELDLGQARQFIKKMVSKDSLAMRNAIDKAAFGLKLLIQTECRRCGEELEIAMPWTEEFFRPRDE